MLKALKLLKLTWNPMKKNIRHHPFPATYQHLLRNLPPTRISTLSNGIVVATEERECCNACVGLYVNAGARHESGYENGITHFFEHIAFKGTHNRSKTVIEEQMACTGGRFKCFTTREMSAYYAECLCRDVPLAIDILADCLFCNSYSVPDIEYQKNTAYLEMLEHDRDTNEVLFDYLHSTAFQGTPLSHTVMGPTTNLYNFNESTICLHIAKYFDPTRMVLAAVGGLKHEQILSLAEKYLGIYEPHKCLDEGTFRYTGSEVMYRDDTMTVGNVAIAVEGPCFCDDDNLVMHVAAGVVGGWDKSQPGGTDHGTKLSRAASSWPFCDAYQSFNINYSDTGLWGIHFISPKLTIEEMVYNTQDEWMNLCNMITMKEVERAKRELKTKLLSEMQSVSRVCHDIGRWVLYNGNRPQLHEQICAIDRVFVKEIREVCNKYIYDRCPAVAAIGSLECLPEYNRIRSGMYWLRI